jgi:DedD protein
MNHLLDHPLDQDLAESSQDREISLGPGTILGIFFGLALLCGAVFGFGYSMGRRSAQTAAQSAPPAVLADAPAQQLPSTAKPAAGYTARQPATAPAASGPSAVASKPVAQPSESPAPAALPQPTSNGTFMVQVAAVSTQEIADIELAALRKFNYQVTARHEPTDQLLHIQIGPFATKKEAEAMRQNVLSHGFNAIVK